MGGGASTESFLGDLEIGDLGDDEVSAIWRKYSKSANGDLSREQFDTFFNEYAAVKGISSEKLSAVREASFKALDQNGDGKITKKDMKRKFNFQ